MTPLCAISTIGLSLLVGMFILCCFIEHVPPPEAFLAVASLSISASLHKLAFNAIGGAS